MEYAALDSLPYYGECNELVSAMGYALVDLKLVQSRGNTHVAAVITSTNAGVFIGTDDTAKVTRVLLQRLQALTGNQDMSMEVTSPGVERVIKNAAEFALFVQRRCKVWDKTLSDWVGGKIVSASGKSVILEKEKTDERVEYSFEQIAKAKLTV
ncbi:MAG: hypothetical protein Ta2A_26150 [Treponemataceae bacterium]|nr:MAG: hypothetical protein Ta2A_26150 [Treponemataceae bacterium]